MADLDVVWRKSSFSGGNNGACVELSNQSAIRDSKNPEAILSIGVSDLIIAVKAGRFDR
jgi:Domain of unknown function (DUF397)